MNGLDIKDVEIQNGLMAEYLNKRKNALTTFAQIKENFLRTASDREAYNAYLRKNNIEDTPESFKAYQSQY